MTAASTNIAISPRFGFIKDWCLVVVLFFAMAVASSSAQPLASPVIGILSQPLGETKRNMTDKDYVIAASYVKWLEAGGARSIPIPYDAHPEMVDELFPQINGLLLPGGASEVPPVLYHLLSLARNTSKFFPVWGTCLGFEYLVKVFSHDSTSQVLTPGFDAENISLPLVSVQRRQLYKDDKIYNIVTKHNVTMNNHMNGVEPGAFTSNQNLNRLFRITSVNHDRKGRPFVSTIEPRHTKTFPFYGVQYHPEKNAFEYGTFPGTNIPYEAIDHSEQAVELSTYLARFFVLLAKENPHSYTNPSKYPLVETFPMKRGLAFEQYYVIPCAKSLAPPQSVHINILEE
jgi:gamma-glutamyl hydrolase